MYLRKVRCEAGSASHLKQNYVHVSFYTLLQLLANHFLTCSNNHCIADLPQLVKLYSIINISIMANLVKCLSSEIFGYNIIGTYQLINQEL